MNQSVRRTMKNKLIPCLTIALACAVVAQQKRPAPRPLPGVRPAPRPLPGRATAVSGPRRMDQSDAASGGTVGRSLRGRGRVPEARPSDGPEHAVRERGWALRHLDPGSGVLRIPSGGPTGGLRRIRGREAAFHLVPDRGSCRCTVAPRHSPILDD